MKKNNLLFITGFIGLSMVIAGCGEPAYVPVEEVSISGSNTVEVGETIQLSAAVSPDNATKKTITWSSSNPEFAIVSETGMVTGVAKGTVTITASAADDKSNSMTIRVTKNYAINYPSVEGVTFTGPAKAEAGDKVSFSITTNYAIESVKMNGTECTRGEDGFSFTMPEGEANITIKTMVPVTSVTISGPSVVEKGATITLSAAVAPETATYKDVTWSSEDANIASVNEAGVVSGAAKGTTNIIATAHNGVNASYAVVVTEHFAVTYPTVEGVTFDGPTSAQEGELVEFSITTNKALASVKMNGNECGTSNGKYYFYMPNGAANVTVTEAVAPVVTGHVINIAAGNVSFVGPSRAEKDEVVSLVAMVNPGYALTSVTVYGNINAFDPADRTVIASNFLDGIVSFVMPDEDVKVEFTATANYYDLTFVSDSEEALGQVGSTVKNVATGETIRTVEDNKVRHVPYGTTVSVSVITTSYYAKKVITTGLVVDGVTYPVEDNIVTFTMPFHSVAAEIVYEELLRPFEIVNSDHISLALFSKVGEEYVAYTKTGLVYGDTIYFKATIEEESGVAVKAVKVVHKSSSGTDQTVSVSGPNADGYYSFTVPEAVNTITISVTELNPNKFAGRAFLGNYAGFNLYNGKPFAEPGLSDNASVAASGELKYRGTLYELDTADDATGIMELTNGYKIGYTLNFMFAGWNLSSSSIIGVDNMIYYKMAEGASKSDYKFYAVQTADKLSNMVDVYKGGEHVDGLFIHFTDEGYDVYSGVKFVFDDNTKRISDEGALAFEVRDANDAYICEFSGNSTSNSAVLDYNVKDGLQGTYTGEAGDLVLNGIGGATIAGDAYTYVVIDGQVNLARETNTRIDSYVVTLEGSTYTILDQSHESITKSIFAGFTFDGGRTIDHSDDGWDDSDTVKVVFDNKAGTITGSIYIRGTTYKIDFTAEYDETSHVLTLTIVGDNMSLGFTDQVLTVNVAEGAITFVNSFTGRLADSYDVTGVTLSNSDFHL